MNENKKIYDLVIVGGGLTGLMAAHFAVAAGIKRMLVIDPDIEKQQTSRLPVAIAFNTFTDNVTRLSHTWGLDKAESFLSFANHAYENLKSTLDHFQQPYEQGSLSRPLLSAEERREADIACQQLVGIGQLAAIQGTPVNSPVALFGEQVGDTKYCAYNLIDLLAATRKTLTPYLYRGEVTQVVRTPSTDYEITLHSGERYSARFLILANHLRIPSLIKELSSVFVATSEQVVIFSQQGTQRSTASIVNYGHEVYAPLSCNRIFASGARFLRPMQGVATASQINDKITKFLEQRVKQLYPGATLPKVVGAWHNQECRPCDELPIIGPMFGERGILLASGYMMQGASFAITASKTLIELISQGSSNLTPLEWSPVRFRGS